jgi:ubiquinol-cytochrome c reductase cytochrome c1 subunit
MVEKNLVFNADKVGSPIISSMPKKGAEAWFGTTPPDLSLVARSKGTDWIYTYLRSFYKDNSRPFGVNNKVLTNVSMPDVLWHLKESKSTKDFNQDVRDITNFLDYVGEPAKLVRVDLGYKVLGFFFILLILSYLLINVVEDGFGLLVIIFVLRNKKTVFLLKHCFDCTRK